MEEESGGTIKHTNLRKEDAINREKWRSGEEDSGRSEVQPSSALLTGRNLG